VSTNGVLSAFADGELGFVDETALAAWVAQRRWYATKGRGIAQASVVQALPLGGEPPLVLALVQLRFHSGTWDLYNVLVGLRPAADGLDEESICEADGWVVYGALADPVQCRRLARLLSASAVVERPSGRVEFHGLQGSAPLAASTRVRALSGEQSNTSLVYDEQVVLKVFRRLAAGTNPELEMLRFLSERGCENIPELLGWFEHRGERIDATLGIAVRHVAEARDGWRLALDALVAGEGETLMASLTELGAVTGRMHTLLASDPEDPDFAPEEPSSETTALLAATIDEHLERTIDEHPDAVEAEEVALGNGGGATLHLAERNARDARRRDQCADARARIAARHDAALLERAHHADVRESLQPSAAEYEGCTLRYEPGHRQPPPLRGTTQPIHRNRVWADRANGVGGDSAS